MGVIGYLEYNSCTIEDSPILFIIPNESFTEDKLDNIHPNDKIKVKILDTRIKFMNKQIQVVSEPLV